MDKASEPAENITSRQDQETDGYAEVEYASEEAVASEPAGNTNQDSQDTTNLQDQVGA